MQIRVINMQKICIIIIFTIRNKLYDFDRTSDTIYILCIIFIYYTSLRECTDNPALYDDVRAYV